MVAEDKRLSVVTNIIGYQIETLLLNQQPTPNYDGMEGVDYVNSSPENVKIYETIAEKVLEYLDELEDRE